MPSCYSTRPNHFTACHTHSPVLTSGASPTALPAHAGSRHPSILHHSPPFSSTQCCPPHSPARFSNRGTHCLSLHAFYKSRPPLPNLPILFLPPSPCKPVDRVDILWRGEHTAPLRFSTFPPSPRAPLSRSPPYQPATRFPPQAALSATAQP